VGVQAGTASTLRVTWQGCADEGLCYPPVEKDIVLASTGPSAAAPSAPVPAASTTGRIDGGHRCRQRRRHQPPALATFAGLDPAPLLRPGHRAGVHALRAAHGAHPLEHGGGQRGHPAPRLAAVPGFRRADGGGLCGHGRAGRAGGRRAAGLDAEPVDPAVVRRRVRRAGTGHVRLLRTATAGVPARPPREQDGPGRISHGRGGDGRAVRRAGRPLHDGAAGGHAAVHRAGRLGRGRRAAPAFTGARHGRAAGRAQHLGRTLAAAPRPLDRTG
jgi:hypothetical protein